MLLAIDVGNTRINYGVFKGRRLISQKNISTKSSIKFIHKSSPLSKCFTTYSKKEMMLQNKLFQQKSPFYCKGLDKNITEVIIGSVVPSITKKIKKNFKVPVYEVSTKLDLGIKVMYDNPKKVGADRLANAVAVKGIYGTPAFIVDFGTATTIDVISKEGNYLGGVILPGLDMARRNLNDNTALLPLVKIKRPKKILGKNTKTAIQSGLYYGFCGMIKQLILDLKKELHLPHKTVIITTGGDAKLFSKYLGVKADTALTLKGLRLIYARQKHC